MDGFLSSSFIKEFPKKVRKTLFDDSSTYYELLLAIKAGRLIAGTQGKAFVSVLEELKNKEPELYKLFISLEASGKLTAKEVSEHIPESLKDIKIRKSVLKKIGGAYSQPADVIYHDSISDVKWKKEIIKAGRKPLVENRDLRSGDIEYLFKEISIPLNQDDEFNWPRFLSSYILPFKRIRILDPYLYVNIKGIDINNILRILLKQSITKNMSVEIISDLSADRNRKKENVLQSVWDEINLLESCKSSIKLFTQKGSASKYFHKRAIWTDFWVLHTERGFDFLNLETGNGSVKRENTLFLTGKYSSKDSLWHQINENWGNYLKHSKLV